MVIARLRSHWRQVASSPVALLISSTTVVQGLLLLALPILTRLYSPENYSVLAVFSSIVALISVAACFRFEIAIPLQKTDEEAAAVLLVALTLSFASSLLVGLVVWRWGAEISELLRTPLLLGYLWLIPLAVWATSSSAALLVWATRKSDFKVVAVTRVQQSLSGAATQISLGLLGFTGGGLVLGQVINNALGIFKPAANLRKNYRSAFSSVGFGGMRQAMVRNRDFPKYSTFEALANSGHIQLPLILIAGIAAGPEAGYLLLAMRVMQAPLSLIGSAYSQLYVARLAGEVKPDVISSITLETVTTLARIGSGPLLFAGIVSPVAFRVFFGEQWERAGIIVAWMVPWCMAELLASPVSMALHRASNQRGAMALQAFGLVLRVGAVCVASIAAVDLAVEFYALSGFIFYATYLWVVIRTAKISTASLNLAFHSVLPRIVFWLSLGAIFHALQHGLM